MVVEYDAGRETQVGFIYTREWYADYIAYRMARKSGQVIMMRRAGTNDDVAWAPVDVIGTYFRVRPLTNTFPD